jgi:hypothetical protein
MSTAPQPLKITLTPIWSGMAALVPPPPSRITKAAKVCGIFIVMGAIFGLLRNPSLVDAMEGATMFFVAGLFVVAMSNPSGK